MAKSGGEKKTVGSGIKSASFAQNNEDIFDNLGIQKGWGAEKQDY